MAWKFCLRAGTVEYVVHTMNFKALTGATLNLLFCSNIKSNEEPISSNIFLETLCG